MWSIDSFASRYSKCLLVVLLLVLTLQPGSSEAQGASAEDVIIDEIGPGWTLVEPGPEPNTVDSAVRLFSSEDATIQVLAEPSINCQTGLTGRSDELLLIRGLQREPAVSPGVDYFAADALGGLEGTASVAALFSTANFAFLLFAVGSDPIEMRAALELIVDRQAARDGGIVVAAVPAPSLLDHVMITTPPIGGLGDPVDLTTDQFACEPLVRTSTVVAFLSRHSTERQRAWLDGSTESLATIWLIDYPYDLLAGIAAGGSMSAEFRRLADIDRGFSRIPDVRVWQIDGERSVYIARFRRGSILAVVMVTVGDDPSKSMKNLAAFADAQFAAMPTGSTTAVKIPGPAQSMAESSALIAGVGVVVLAIRRIRAGRVPRTAVIRDEARSVDVTQHAHALRRQGFVLAVGQVVCIAAALVVLTSDLGWIRSGGTAVWLLIGIGGTLFWRRREARALGTSVRDRTRSRLSMGAAALTITGLGLLGGGAGLVVWGVRETLFTPSITHLRLSDRLSLEPRRVAWMLAVIGLLFIVTASFVLRAARARARSGWRERAMSAPPIVYLRSFEDDDVQLASVVSARRPFLEFFNPRGRDAFEESVAWELSCYGPVLAIARPGGSSASLGAARMHFSDDEWKTEISERIAEARSVVVTIGRTPGLAWELSHLVHTGQLGKTIFVVPPLDSVEISRRWSFVDDTLWRAGAGHHPLPAEPSCVVTVEVDQVDGTTIAYCADRRDEATYRAAVSASLASEPTELVVSQAGQ
jgi:hypothetical protein